MVMVMLMVVMVMVMLMVEPSHHLMIMSHTSHITRHAARQARGAFCKREDTGICGG